MLDILREFGDSTLHGVVKIIEIAQEAVRENDGEKLLELKEQALEEAKVMVQNCKLPKYMDCVTFTCKKGAVLTEEQQTKVKNILA